MKRVVVVGGVLLLAGCGGAARVATPAPAVASRGIVSASPTRAAPAPAAAALIARATWTRTSQGRQLRVVPTADGRTDQSVGASARAWAEVLRLAPDADTPGMRDQFQCHWDYARLVEPNKPSWNLEPWRPAVGYAKTVAALCNPGGPEG